MVKTAGVETSRQDYLGGIELKNNKIEAIYNEEGRAYNTSTTAAVTWRREYNLKDHLGNTRVSFSDLNGNGIIENQTEILSETHYYPFGLQFDGGWYDNNVNKNRYLYNGKEWNSEFGLNLEDYGARWYDPSIGRWWVIDPITENQEPFSPYHYVADNPVRLTDPDGRFPIPFAIPIVFAALEAIGVAVVDVLVAAAVVTTVANVSQDGVQPGTRVAHYPMDGAENRSAWTVQSSPKQNGANSNTKVKDEDKAKETTKETSQEARRESMRKEGIPTSQQPKSQSKNASGREYTYDTPKKGGGTEKKSVQQQTKDRNHDQPHWEAGKIRKDADGNTKMNNHGRPRLDNDKSKVNY